MPSLLRAALLCVCVVVDLALAVSPSVKLNYTTYQGTALSNGVTQWLGMRYAAPPLGNLRFSAPQPPPRVASVVKANAHGPTCLTTNQAAPSSTMSEDCLFLDVYAPSSATTSSKLPVYFFIQGGGFNYNSNANYNGSGLILASSTNIVVVNFNYRVGPYGFLASQEVLKNGSVNNGLKDQRQALHWVQSYIASFGGDPTQVTLGGASAGAQSVDLHVTAYGGRNDGLFARTAAESQSFSALRSVSESQFMYDNLVSRANCTSSSNTLVCLRSLTAAKLQTINYNTPFPGAAYAPLYMYGPTLDNDFITDFTYNAYANGKFVKQPAIAGDDTNEGTMFVPKSTNSYYDTNTFLQDNFPNLTPAQLQEIDTLYPVNGTPTFPGAGAYWREGSDAYGDMRYTCPGVFISDIYSNMSIASNWNYRWNVIDPPANASGLGVQHTIETNAIWGPANTGSAPASYSAGGVNNPIVAVVQGYWTSFIRCGNPNDYRLAGTPVWGAWNVTNPYQRLMFQTNDTQMETVSADQLQKCRYWWAIGVGLEQ